MNEDLCQIIPGNTSLTGKTKWQNILIMVGLTVLFLILSYFFYKFVSHTNKRFKMVETAINQMNDRLKERPVVAEAQNPPYPFQHLFMQQAPMPQQQQPQVMQVPRAAPPTVSQPVEVVDARVLDKELSEELKELNVMAAPSDKQEEPEGRVDVIQETEEVEQVSKEE
jgi:hypothetical protein